MKLSVDPTPLADQQVDAIVLPFAKGSDSVDPWADLDEALGGALGEALASQAFKGEVGRCLTLPTRGAVPAVDVLLAGTGDDEGSYPELERLRRAVAAGIRVARRRGARRVAVGVRTIDGHDAGECACGCAEAAVLGAYRFLRYKSSDEEELTEVTLAVEGIDELEVERAVRVALATCWVRDLINESPSQKRPPAFAEQAAEMAGGVGLSCRVIDHEEAAEIGLKALLAVGQGSHAPPRLVVLEHRPEGAEGPPVLLVGKGVTFDTGGISIKPSGKMDAMKGDMSGAAAVLGAMRAVAELELPLHVVGITPMAENMPGGSAYRPGDILESYSGKTIEVLNTDAEGRLILADALAWGTEQYQPRCVIDLATLTGAVVVALGNEVAGIYSSDDELAETLIAAGERTGDRIWRLPVWPLFRSLIESKVADIKNTGGRPASSISAAKFLQEFVGDTPWAHLDIAGPAYVTKSNGYRTRGGTGFAVRLLVDWLRHTDGATS